MTKENALKAYNKAIENGQQDIADNILIRHPEFKETPKETKSKKEK